MVVKDRWIFLSERLKGVHVIDNSDPASPRTIAFLNVPGNLDLAMKGNTLYADSFVDLVAIDISDPAKAVVTGRLENIYPNEPLPDEGTPWVEPIDPLRGVVVGREFINSPSGSCGGSVNGCSGGGGADSAVAPQVDPTTGINGSLARITIVDDHLYLLAGPNLKAVSIADSAHPVEKKGIGLGPDIETLYSHENALFVGGRTGVQIIDISMPDDPVLLSMFQHTWQCDPIVVGGKVGYVTLRAGGPCGAGGDRLEVLDVSDLSAPKLLKSYSLQEPHGLAIDENRLFVAVGSSGFQVFDAADPLNLIGIAHFPERPAEDIILYEGRAHLIGPNGLFQYDYSTLENIVFLSEVPVIP